MYDTVMYLIFLKLGLVECLNFVEVVWTGVLLQTHTNIPIKQFR